MKGNGVRRRSRSGGDCFGSTVKNESLTLAVLRRQQGRGRGDEDLWRRRQSDFALSLGSPSALPCPDSSPAFNLQFSKHAGDGHYLAFGTEWGKLVVADTRVEAAVQRDSNGPVGPGPLQPSSSVRNRAPDGNGSLRTGGTTAVPRVTKASSCSRSSFGGRGVGQPLVVAEWQALTNCVFDVEWMQGDRLIALGCGDNFCRVQDTETQTEVCSFVGHRGSVKSVSANPREQCVVLTGSRDGTFALWDTRLLHRDKSNAGRSHSTDAEELVPFGTPSSVSLRPIEQVVDAHPLANPGSRKRPRSYQGVTIDGNGTAWRHLPAGAAEISRTGRILDKTHNWNHSVTAVEWMSDGQKFITAGQDGLVKLWDTRHALRPLVALEHSPPERHGSSSSISSSSRNGARGTMNGQIALHEVPPMPISSSSSSPGRGGSTRGSVRRKPRAVGRDVGEIRGGGVVAREISDAGRPYGVSSVHARDYSVAVCTVKNHISVYTYAAGTLIPKGVYVGNNNTNSYYIKAKLSPDGSMLASGSPGDEVCLWEVDSPGTPVARLQGHVNEVTGIDWCRSEELKLASCSDDETVRLWTFDPCTREALLPRSRSSHRHDRSRTPTLSVEHDGVGGSTESTAGYGGDVPPTGKFGPGKACIGENSRWTDSPYQRPVHDLEKGVNAQPSNTVVTEMHVDLHDSIAGGDYVQGVGRNEHMHRETEGGTLGASTVTGEGYTRATEGSGLAESTTATAPGRWSTPAVTDARPVQVFATQPHRSSKGDDECKECGYFICDCECLDDSGGWAGEDSQMSFLTCTDTTSWLDGDEITPDHAHPASYARGLEGPGRGGIRSGTDGSGGGAGVGGSSGDGEKQKTLLSFWNVKQRAESSAAALVGDVGAGGTKGRCVGTSATNSSGSAGECLDVT